MRIPLQYLPLLVAAFMLVWNVMIAGWIASRRDTSQWFTRLTALAGLLIAPAAVLALASSSDDGARTITGVTWLWPATCLLVALQALMATARRLVSSSVGLPIVAYNVVVAMIALGDDFVARSGSAPLLLQGAVASRDAVLGIVMGRMALESPLSIFVPLLAPAYPARWRSSALVRAILVLVAAASFTLMVMELPRGIGAVRSYSGAARSVDARDARGFLIGMRLLPTVAGLPSSRAIRTGAQLAERLSPDALLIVMNVDAVNASGLDSLDRVLAAFRADSIRMIVALHYAEPDARLLDGALPQLDRARIAAVSRAVERLRPYAVIPMLEPLFPAPRHISSTSEAWWRVQHDSAAAAVRRVRPATRVLWVATHFDAADSTRYLWATGSDSPIDEVGFAPTPSFGGLASLNARLRSADRWVRSANQQTQPHWILTAGLPRAHGDAAQASAIRHVLAWSAERSWVRAVLIGDPSDADGMLGLNAANGRERPAVSSILRALGRSDALP